MSPAAILRLAPCFVVLAFAAGCASAETEEVGQESAAVEDGTDNAKSSSSTTMTASLGEVDSETAPIPVECPKVANPRCEPGETIRLKKNAAGCMVPRCGIVCAEKPEPTCSEGEGLRNAKDANGCPVSYCFTK